MKPFLNLLLLSFFTLNLFAQNTNDVTLTVVGSGKTIEEAKTNALRSAIEQAYGAFVSSNTEILNDEIVKDEIVSISSGNIKEFKILSQSELTENLVSMTLSATVSVSQLQSYAQSKGASIEFAGGTFAMNMKLQKLNEDAETAAIKNLCAVLDELYKKCFDFKIEASEPLFIAEDRYKIEYTITSTSNSNYPAILELIYTTLKNISMEQVEIDDYIKSGKNVHSIGCYDGELKNDHQWLNGNYTNYNDQRFYSKQWKKEQMWFKPSSNLKSSDIENISTFFTLRTAGSLKLLKNHFISSNAAPFLFAICINGTPLFYPTIYEDQYKFSEQTKVTHGGYWIINETDYYKPGGTGFPDVRTVEIQGRALYSGGRTQVKIDNNTSHITTYTPFWTWFFVSCAKNEPKEIKTYYLENKDSFGRLQFQTIDQIRAQRSYQQANSGIGYNNFSLVISNKSNYIFTSKFTQFLSLIELEKISEITVEPIYE